MRLVRWVHLLLVVFFVSSCFSFVFPLFIPLLVEAGLKDTEASLLLAVGFLCSAILMPVFGRLLDQGWYIRYGLFAGVALILGVLPLVADLGEEAFLLLFLYILGVSMVSSLTKRFTEGAWEGAALKKYSALTYFSENLGLAFAGVVAYLYITDFKGLLIHIDVITSLSLVLFLCTFYKKLLPPELRYVEPRKTFEKGLFAEKIIGQPALFLSLLGVVVVSLAHLSALPALFVSRGLPALQWTSIVLIVNSVTVVIFGPFLWLGVIGLSTKLQLAIGISLMAVGNVLVGFWHSFYGVVFTTVVWSMGEVLLYPVFALVVLRQFSQECRGVGTAFKSSIIQAALFLCPIMTAGMLAISTERYHFLYILVFGSLPLVGYFAISKAIERD